MPSLAGTIRLIGFGSPKKSLDPTSLFS